jgi:ABC-2 type transport system permease protein
LTGFALEAQRLARSPGRLALLLAPFLATAVCLMVYGQRVARNLPVAVIDQDHSGISRQLVRDLSAAPQMQLREMGSVPEAMEAFRKGTIRAAALLPDGLDQEIRLGRTGRVVFWRDASNPLAANQLYSAISTIVSSEGARLTVTRLAAVGLPLSQAKEMALPLRSDARGMYNPGFDYLANFAPGLFPMFLQMGLMLAAGTMLPAGWKSTQFPLRNFLGRSALWLGFDFLLAGSYYLWLLPLLGIPHAPALPTLGLIALLLGVSTAFGGLIGCITVQGPLQAMQLLLAFNTPAFPLSGYTFPEWAMPETMRMLTRPLPFSLFVDAYRGFAGWASDRAWIGLGGLLLWILIPGTLLILASFRLTLAPEIVPPNPDHHHPATGGLMRAVAVEFQRVRTTSGLSTLFFGAPLLYFALYGSMYMFKEERKVPLAIVHGQSSGLARELVRGISAHPNIAALPFASQEEARLALKAGKVRGILELPENLDVRLRRREATAIPLLFTTDRFLPANDLQRGVAEVLLWRGLQERILILESRGISSTSAKERAVPLALDDRPLANPRETYGDFMLPALGILVIHQLYLIAIAFATAIAPPPRRRDLLARLALFTGWFGIWCTLWITVALPFFQVPMHPKALPLFLLGALGLLGVGLLGMLVGLVLKRPLFVLQLCAFTSYPFFFSSGASWPREALPALVGWFSRCIPLTPWLQGLNRSIRLEAITIDVLPELAHLAVLVAVWGTLVALLARRARNRSAMH